MSKLTKKIIIICLILILCALVYMFVPLIYRINIMIKHTEAYNNFFENNNYKYTLYQDYGGGQIYSETTYYKDGKAKSITNYSTINLCVDNYFFENDYFVVNNEQKEFHVYNKDNYPRFYIIGKPISFEPIKTTMQVSRKSFFEKLAIVWKNNLQEIIPCEIITEEHDGKECYKCTFISTTQTTQKYSTISKTVMYIDKETNLAIDFVVSLFEKGDHLRRLSKDRKLSCSYEINTVTDADIQLPDLTDYKQILQYYK